MSLGPEWAYHITIEGDHWPTIQDWCEANIGKFNDTWYKLGIDPAASFIYGVTRSVWYFKHERDAVLFSLRWAGNNPLRGWER